MNVRTTSAAQFPRGLRSPFWFSARARQMLMNSHKAYSCQQLAFRQGFASELLHFFPPIASVRSASLLNISPYCWMKSHSDHSVEHACARCQDQTGALQMFCDTNESESCLVKAPAKHASESVLVVGELLCTGVQANTERHTRKETREMCACWGYKQHSSSRKSGEWRDSNFQQSSRMANLGS